MVGPRLSQAFSRLTPEQMENLNTTRDKHIVGKWLTLATAAVCFIAFLNEVLDGGERSMRMATAIMDSWLLFLAAYLGINVAQYGVKRVTDRDTQVAVQTAKKAPIIVPPVTNEHPAQPPVKQEVNVNVGKEEGVD